MAPTFVSAEISRPFPLPGSTTGSAGARSEAAPTALMPELCEGRPQGRVRYLNQSTVRLVHLEDQVDRAANRERGDCQTDHDRDIKADKKPNAHKEHDEPEDQHGEQRHGNRSSHLRQHQPAGLTRLNCQGQRLRLQCSLTVTRGREFLNGVENGLNAFGGWLVMHFVRMVSWPRDLNLTRY